MFCNIARRQLCCVSMHTDVLNNTCYLHKLHSIGGFATTSMTRNCSTLLFSGHPVTTNKHNITFIKTEYENNEYI